jgi:hypothetical protein
VLGVDETGLRVAKRQDWVRVTATGKLTLVMQVGLCEAVFHAINWVLRRGAA